MSNDYAAAMHSAMPKAPQPAKLPPNMPPSNAAPNSQTPGNVRREPVRYVVQKLRARETFDLGAEALG
ncbi:hypothetical protein B0A49_04037 [Cryomyces minteri]|uniref:Uncharacterized protein n=1 Tax=Cryomyces minteri TaxID=331657 RepID=A0A4U0WZ09_9PEZI|nr:hypothetical protein B0A49_04037 [Cryomyces minteri]